MSTVFQQALRKASIIAVVMVLWSIQLVAGSVSILPLKPTAGSTITLEYTPDASRTDWLKDPDGVYAVVYAFTADNEMPNAYAVPLKADGKRLTGNHKLEEPVVYLMVKVGKVSDYDNNRQEFWDARIYDANGKAVQFAAFREAASYLGGFPENLKREADQDHALELMDEEGRMYPKSIAARINTVLIRQSKGVFSEAEAKAKIADLLPANPQPVNIAEAVALVQGYGVVGRELDVNRVADYARPRWPNSRLDEQTVLQQLSQAKTAEMFLDGALEYMHRFPNGLARQSIVDAALSNTTRAGDYVALQKFIEGADGLHAAVYQQAVNYLGAIDSLRPVAFEFIQRGFKAAKNDKLRPSYLTIPEWNDYQRIAESNLWFVKGAIENAQNKETDAVESFKKAIEIGGQQTERGAYDLYVAILKKQGKHDDVVRISGLAIKNGNSSDSLDAAYKASAAKLGQSRETIESNLATLRQNGRTMAAKKFASNMLNMPMIDGTFTDLQGKNISIHDWKGKVVILDYWATWCGPCKMSFPSLQKLYEKYKDNPNVVFAIVNVWERTEDRTKTVKDFLASNKNITFPMMIDKTDDVVKKYGVTGIPTKFFLGKDGRIQFKEVGLLPEAQFLSEAENKIELLLAQ